MPEPAEPPLPESLLKYLRSALINAVSLAEQAAAAIRAELAKIAWWPARALAYTFGRIN